jgi:hypothetical protein
VTKLEPSDYWRLRTSSAELERDQAALVVIQTRLDATRARHDALWRSVLTQYGLDPQQRYVARDDECALDVPPNGSGPA